MALAGRSISFKFCETKDARLLLAFVHHEALAPSPRFCLDLGLEKTRKT